MQDNELETIRSSFDLIQRDLSIDTSVLDPSESPLPHQYAFYHKKAIEAIHFSSDYQQFLRARTVIALGLLSLENGQYYDIDDIINIFLVNPSLTLDKFFQDSLTRLSTKALIILNLFSKYEEVMRVKCIPTIENKFDPTDLRTIYTVTGLLIAKAVMRSNDINLYEFLENETQKTLFARMPLSLKEQAILSISFALTLVSLELGYDTLYFFEQLLEKDHEVFFKKVRSSLSQDALSVLENLGRIYKNQAILHELVAQEPDEVHPVDFDYNRFYRLFLNLKIRLDDIDELDNKYLYLNSIGYTLRQINGHIGSINYEKLTFILLLLYIDYGDKGLEEYLPHLSSPDTFIQKVRSQLQNRSKTLLREYELNAYALAHIRGTIFTRA